METKNTTNDVCRGYTVWVGSRNEVISYEIPANEVKKPTETQSAFIKRVGKEISRMPLCS